MIEQVSDLRTQPSTPDSKAWAVSFVQDTWGVPPRQERTKPLSASAPTTAALPQHEWQTDNGLGTLQHPVNNNCQTTTLKNLFHFYGMDQEAGKVNGQLESLLSDIQTKKGADLDHNALDQAIGQGDPHYAAAGVEDDIKHGQLEPTFVQPVTIDGLMIDGKPASGEAVMPATMEAYLSEMGTKPQTLQLGEGNSAQVKQALDSGKPVFISDNDTHTLDDMQYSKQTGTPLDQIPNVQGHIYMAFKKGDQYYVSDPEEHKLRAISPDVMQRKLEDPNSEAVIINARPNPDSFLHHPAATGS